MLQKSHNNKCRKFTRKFEIIGKNTAKIKNNTTQKFNKTRKFQQKGAERKKITAKIQEKMGKTCGKIKKNA